MFGIIVSILGNPSVLTMLAFFFPFIIFLKLLLKLRAKKEKIFEPGLMEARINSFKPEPLVKLTGTDSDHSVNTVWEENRSIIDLAKVNYLNVLNNTEIKESAADCIKEYGVGTCGPRGFFGSTELHINLESKLSEFLGTEDAIVYAYGFTTLQTSIAAYCKKDDLIFCDDYINFPIRQGMLSSRSEFIFFEHNNPKDLRQKLEENQSRDKRKFLLVEGIYQKTGKVCKLPEMMKLAKEFKLRVFVDETISFGVLGINGKGITEHHKIPVSEIDMIIGSLENALGSIGGFCAGSNAVIEHQRLCSASYIYSASLPTYLVQVSSKALAIVENNSIFLQILATRVQAFLCSIDSLRVISDPISPLKIFVYKKERRNKGMEEAIFEYCRDHYLYLILNSNGVNMHLNVELYFNADRLEKMFQIISDAVRECEAKN